MHWPCAIWDTAHAHTSKIVPPTVGEVVIQSIVGEVVYGGAFFGLKGNELLPGQSAKITTAYDPSIAYSVSWIVSSIAITVWGNAFSYGENNCWRPMLGGLAGFLIFVSTLGPLGAGATELGAYIVISSGFLAGEIATYYLWPTSPEPSSNRSSSKILIAPFFSPQMSGIGFSYPIQ